MFNSPGRNTVTGNVHPAVANRSGGALATQALYTMESRSAAGAAGAPPDADEAEARSRAREILQDFMKQKARCTELEQQLQRATQENERLAHIIHERKTESVLDREKFNRELESLRVSKSDSDSRALSARDEVKKVAQACAQRAADSQSHLRLREQEVQQLEAELLRAREEIRALRTEVLRLQNTGNSMEEVEKSQQRVVEIAKKLLDSEKAKSQLERSIVEDRRYQQQALRTIEGLRKQCSDSEQRLKDVEQASHLERDKYDAAVAALHKEMDMQRDLYKTFMLQLGRPAAAHSIFSSGVSSVVGDGNPYVAAFHSSDAAASHHAAALSNKDHDMGILRAKVEGLTRVNAKLEQEVSARASELEEVKTRLFDERSQHVEAIGKLQTEIHCLQSDVATERQRSSVIANAHHSDRDSFLQLQAAHETVKQELQMVRKDAAAALSSLDTAAAQHQALMEEMGSLREEVLAREAVEKQLKDALENRRQLENRLSELKIKHSHELEIQRLQMSQSFGAGAGPELLQRLSAPGGLLGTPYRSEEDARSSEISMLKERLTQCDLERSAWNQERTGLAREKDALQRDTQQRLEELVKRGERLQAEALAAHSRAASLDREKEEWKSAFAMSERTRAALQAQLDDTRAAYAATEKDRGSQDVRLSMVTSQMQRMEGQNQRDAQELFRLRGRVAQLEQDLARKTVEVKRMEIFRIENENVPPLASHGGLSDVSIRLAREQQLLAKKLELAEEQRRVGEAMMGSPLVGETPSSNTVSHSGADHSVAGAFGIAPAMGNKTSSAGILLVESGGHHPPLAGDHHAIGSLSFVHPPTPGSPTPVATTPRGVSTLVVDGPPPPSSHAVMAAGSGGPQQPQTLLSSQRKSPSTPMDELSQFSRDVFAAVRRATDAEPAVPLGTAHPLDASPTRPLRHSGY